MKGLLLILGVAILTGVAAGMFGVGGGIIMVPMLMYVFKFPPHLAVGTSLAAMILPVGILGVIEYYRKGNVDVRAALMLSIGIFIGAWVGARFSLSLPKEVLRRLFGLFLVVVGLFIALDK
ncbi:MAG: sulfite exporter TauE/SafE family protein [Acidobacteria bacterium]|nr:sulfite exporter TauE/SafE family protein [Acidobacteriota bacterium]